MDCCFCSRVTKIVSYLLIEDVLTESKGECVICLEELQPGDTIARLPCLCVYHRRYLGVFSYIY